MNDEQFLKSTFYEQLVEHVFIAEILQEVWYRHGKTTEVLRSEVDASGFDLVLECQNIMRHVQLKTSGINSKTTTQKVNIALAQKASGCVIWLLRHEDSVTHRMNLKYLFFGARPGEPLPSLDGFKVGKHTKVSKAGIKGERPFIRVVPKRHFELLPSITELVQRLFGLA
jgi:hypothetical protein